MPNSPRKSIFRMLSLIIAPVSSCFASKVPLKSFDINTDMERSLIFMSLKAGRTDSSFANERIGPGIPVPLLLPVELLEPETSLTRWKNQIIVPYSIFVTTSSPMKARLFSGTSAK